MQIIRDVQAYLIRKKRKIKDSQKIDDKNDQKKISFAQNKIDEIKKICEEDKLDYVISKSTKDQSYIPMIEGMIVNVCGFKAILTKEKWHIITLHFDKNYDHRVNKEKITRLVKLICFSDYYPYNEKKASDYFLNELIDYHR